MPVQFRAYTPNPEVEAAVSEKIKKMTDIFTDLAQKASPESQQEARADFQGKIDRERQKSNPRENMIKMWQEDIAGLDQVRADYEAKKLIAQDNLNRFQKIMALKPEEKMILRVEPTGDKKADTKLFEDLLNQIDERKKIAGLSREEIAFLDAFEEKISTAKDRLFTYERAETTEFILSASEMKYLQHFKIPDVEVTEEKVKALESLTKTELDLGKERKKYQKDKKSNLASEYHYPLIQISKMKAELFSASDQYGLKIINPKTVLDEVTKLLTTLKSNVQAKKEEKGVFSVLSPISSFTPFKSLKTSRSPSPGATSPASIVRSASAPLPSTPEPPPAPVRSASVPAAKTENEMVSSPSFPSTIWKRGEVPPMTRSQSNPEMKSAAEMSTSSSAPSTPSAPASSTWKKGVSPSSSPREEEKENVERERDDKPRRRL